MNTKKILMLVVAGASLLSASLHAADIEVSANITEDTTWTNDNVYFLETKVFVTEGATLTIEPGTVIKGRESTGDEATALIITRGSKIMAEGTKSQPIIFTSELDDLTGAVSFEDVGLWGGVVVLGNAPINSRADSEPAGDPAEDQVEGIALGGIDPELATFGGTEPNDDSGVMRYISIRHGGARIGGDNEINGLTLGGVGDATTVEFIEVFANKDDGMEIFGGTVNVKYFAGLFGADDGLDLDQGWVGSAQYVFVIGADITDDRADKGGEWDGATSPKDATPVSDYVVANATMIGIGNSLQPDESAGRDNTALNIRDTVKLGLYNSVFTEFAKGYDIENDIFGPTSGDDTVLGTTVSFPEEFGFFNNIFWSHISENNDADGLNGRPDGLFDATQFFDSDTYDNRIVNPGLISIAREKNSNGLDPRPAAGSAASFGARALPEDRPELMQTSYLGAFAPEGPTWLSGWSVLEEQGILVEMMELEDNELLNISTRVFVSDTTFGSRAVASVIVGGTEPITVVFRGRSTTVNVDEDKVADPRITVVQVDEGEIGSNDNFADAANLDLLTGTDLDPANVGEDGMAPEEALFIGIDLAPGAYSVRLEGSDTTDTGIGIVEAFAVRN